MTLTQHTISLIYFVNSKLCNVLVTYRLYCFIMCIVLDVGFYIVHAVVYFIALFYYYYYFFWQMHGLFVDDDC